MNSPKFTPCLQTCGVIPMTEASSDLNDPCSRNPCCTPMRDSARKVSNASGRGGAVLLGREERNQKGTDWRSAERERRNSRSGKESKIDGRTQKGESFVEETRTGAAACGGHVAEPRLGGLRQRWRRP